MASDEVKQVFKDFEDMIKGWDYPEALHFDEFYQLKRKWGVDDEEA